MQERESMGAMGAADGNDSDRRPDYAADAQGYTTLDGSHGFIYNSYGGTREMGRSYHSVLTVLLTVLTTAIVVGGCCFGAWMAVGDLYPSGKAISSGDPAGAVCGVETSGGLTVVFDETQESGTLQPYIPGRNDCTGGMPAEGTPTLDFAVAEVSDTQTAYHYFKTAYVGVYVYSEGHGDVARGDRILTADGAEITSAADLDAVISQKREGDTLALTVSRRGETLAVTVTVTAYSSASTAEPS